MILSFDKLLKCLANESRAKGDCKMECHRNGRGRKVQWMKEKRKRKVEEMEGKGKRWKKKGKKKG